MASTLGPMPIYEYRCNACDERFEEYLSTSAKPAPPCPTVARTTVERLLSMIDTEWLPSDVTWHTCRASTTWAAPRTAPEHLPSVDLRRQEKKAKARG